MNMFQDTAIVISRRYHSLVFSAALLALLPLSSGVALAQDKTAPPEKTSGGNGVAAIVPLNAPPPSGASAAALVRSNDAWKKGDVVGALREVEAALKENDKQTDALNWYGYLLLRQNRPGEAVAPLEKAIMLGGESPELDVNLATALLTKAETTGEELRRAVDLLEKAIAGKPELIDAQVNLGQAYLRSGRPAEAASAYEKLLIRQPDNAIAQRMYGFSLLKAGRTADALTALRRTVELSPQDGEAWGLLGSLELQQGNRTEALQELERARKVGPANASVLSNLGLLYSQSGNYAQSASAYGEAADLNEALTPPNVLPRIHQGIALARSEKWAEAAVAYEKALLRDPKNYEALVNLGSIRYQQGDARRAIALYATAAEERPNTALAWANLGSALDSMRRYRESAAAWRKASNIEPNNRQYSAAFRSAAARAGQNALIIDASKTSADKSSATSLQELGAAYVRNADQQQRASKKQDQLTKALQTLKDAVHRAPGSAAAWNDLGVVYEQRGQVPQALECYKKAFRLDPKFVPARKNLAGFLPEKAIDALLKPAPAPSKPVGPDTNQKKATSPKMGAVKTQKPAVTPATPPAVKPASATPSVGKEATQP